jgi:Leucine-rich repeat (LRR) protein
MNVVLDKPLTKRMDRYSRSAELQWLPILLLAVIALAGCRDNEQTSGAASTQNSLHRLPAEGATDKNRSPDESLRRAVEALRRLELEDELRQAATLRKLNLFDTDATDADLEQLVGLRTLEELTLVGCAEVTNDGVRNLTALPKLRVLYLSGPNISDDALRSVGELKSLVELHLNGPNFGDEGLVHLTKLTGLTILDLQGTQVTDAGLHQLSSMTRLERLNLTGTAITEAGLARIAKLVNLRQLQLSGPEIGDADLSHLSRLTGLQSLTLLAAGLTDAGLKQLGRLTQLEQLDLRFCEGISDVGLPALQRLTHLREIDLRGTHLCGEAVADLKQTLHECTVRW